MSTGTWNFLKSETDQKMDQICTFRVTKKQKNTLLKNAAEQGLFLSEYILASTLYLDNSKIIALKNEFQKAIDELNRVGVNLNQAAKSMNLGVAQMSSMPQIAAADFKKGLEILKKENAQRLFAMQKIIKLVEKVEK